MNSLTFQISVSQYSVCTCSILYCCLIFKLVIFYFSLANLPWILFRPFPEFISSLPPKWSTFIFWFSYVHYYEVEKCSFLTKWLSLVYAFEVKPINSAQKFRSYLLTVPYILTAWLFFLVYCLSWVKFSVRQKLATYRDCYCIFNCFI